MHDPTQVLTLLPQHSRLIDARSGMRLQVLSGCLWLTRPDDPVDHFLSAGASIELRENRVLIESHAGPGSAAVQVTRYALLAPQWRGAPAATRPSHRPDSRPQGTAARNMKTA